MIIGYGVCGGGEANRYLRATLDEFKRLCDETIILGNNLTDAERDLIFEYGFQIVEDNREWGINQWKMKQDFAEKHLAKLARVGDMMVCLDMDETFCRHVTREWIEKAPLDAYYLFIIDLWNDTEHHKSKAAFWNVRIWRWNGDTKWKQKPVHCGLAPEWTYFYHRFAPFLVLHTGLMTKESRERKIARYQTYDPNAVHKDKSYYTMLASDSNEVFNEAEMCKKIEHEVATYQQTKPRTKPMQKVEERCAYVRNPGGLVVPIPERDLEQTLKRKGFEFIEWAGENVETAPEVQQVATDPLACAICGHIAKTEKAMTTHKKKHI